MSALNKLVKNKPKMMAEAAAAFSIGGGILGLLFDKIGSTDSHYLGTKLGALMGALVGAGAAAASAQTDISE
jgi:outer membrane lipoprotein SlyB